MLTDQRREEITRIIYTEGRAYISELADLFNVSGETIRRDLNEIVKNNKIKKVHGGAVCINKPVREEHYDIRKMKNYKQKLAIGKYAAKLIGNNDIIAMDTGTDTESLAFNIRGVKGIIIITNSLKIAQVLSDKRKRGDFDGQIIMLGGDIDSDTDCAYSPLTNEMLSRFAVDKAFVGATAINSLGITSWDIRHGVFTEQLCKVAEKCYFLADSDKFGKHSFYNICPISDLDAIITDNKYPISEMFKESCKKNNCQIYIVDAESVD